MKNNICVYKRRISILVAMAAFAAVAIDAYAGYPSGYYNSLEGKCGAELMQAVKKVVRNHTAIPYGNSTWEVFLDTDVRMVNGTKCWWDMYSNNNVSVSSGHPGMNIEHSIANSWWGGTKNDAYEDIVHLNPSNADANNRKSNYPIAELGTVTWDNGVTFIGKPKSGQGGGATYCYEPCDEYKGDFARVFMYMFTVYDDISWRTSNGYGYMYDTSDPLMFKQWAKELLIRWSSNDPVSQKELDRNDGIYKHQKNRNPFIDLPELADHIWGSKSKEPFTLNDDGGQGNGDDNNGDDNGDQDNPPSGDSVTYTWLNENDASMGEWKIENVTLPSSSSYIWSWKTYNGTHYLNASAFINNTAYTSKAYVWSPEVSLENALKAVFSFSHAAKFQTTLKTLCKVVVRDTETGTVYEESISKWPVAGAWTYTDSGNLDLSKYAGKKVQIGFKYESNTSGADTWEIKNCKLMVENATSSILQSFDEDSDDSFLVEVWGNNILAPQGARIFDMNGREVSGENLHQGVYIVVKPTFAKSVKVIIK